MLLDPDLRVSDADRDETVELLRGHLMAGRLDPDEHEERVGEACRAKFGRDLEHALRELPSPSPDPVPPAPPAAGPPVFVQPRRKGGGIPVGFGVTALLLLIGTFGLAAMLALPLSATAWRLAARSEDQAGLALAVTTTLLSVLALAGWLAVALGVR